jgi:hypothetical protein
MVNEIRMRRVNWIKPSKTKMYEKWSQIQCAKNRCGPVFYVCCLGSGWARPFRVLQAERSAQKFNPGVK